MKTIIRFLAENILPGGLLIEIGIVIIKVVPARYFFKPAPIAFNPRFNNVKERLKTGYEILKVVYKVYKDLNSRF